MRPWRHASLALALVLLVPLAACSSASEEDEAATSAMAEALRGDSLLDLQVPDGAAGDAVFAVGNAEAGVAGVPFTAGRTWNVSRRHDDLITAVLADAEVRGLAISSATCFPGNGGGVDIVGAKRLQAGSAGVVLTIRPLTGDAQVVQLVMTGSPTAGGASDASAPAASPGTVDVRSCDPSVADQIDAAMR